MNLQALLNRLFPGSWGTQAKHPYKADAKLQGRTRMLVLGNHVCEYSSSNGDCTNMEAYIPASLVGSISMRVSQSVLHTSNRCDCCNYKQGMYTTTPKNSLHIIP